MHRIFLLSPARCEGKRAGLLLRERARFDLAARLRSPQGVPLGEVMAFLSGLYFRGKLAYASAFARAPHGTDGVLVITSNRGLRPASEAVRLSTLRSFSRVPIEPDEPRYRRPLARDAHRLARAAAGAAEIVLLGSIATEKYASVLLEAFGDRLKFPGEFVGRGDMSRGGLLLRCVADGRELEYVSLNGAIRRGPTPPRLPRRTAPAGAMISGRSE
jgi:hypothetical protein